MQQRLREPTKPEVFAPEAHTFTLQSVSEGLGGGVSSNWLSDGVRRANESAPALWALEKIGAKSTVFTS